MMVKISDDLGSSVGINAYDESAHEVRLCILFFFDDSADRRQS